MRGQTAAEYMGVLLVAALMIAALAQLDLSGRLGDAVVEQTCRVVNDERDCPAAEKRRARDRKLAQRRKLVT